jgi:hypothetical protein
MMRMMRMTAVMSKNNPSSKQKLRINKKKNLLKSNKYRVKKRKTKLNLPTLKKIPK